MKKEVKQQSCVRLVRLHLRPAKEGVTLSLVGAATAAKPIRINKEN